MCIYIYYLYYLLIIHIYKPFIESLLLVWCNKSVKTWWCCVCVQRPARVVWTSSWSARFWRTSPDMKKIIWTWRWTRRSSWWSRSGPVWRNPARPPDEPITQITVFQPCIYTTIIIITAISGNALKLDLWRLIYHYLKMCLMVILH